MGDLGQITSLWALVSAITKWDFWVRVLGCVGVQPISRIQIQSLLPHTAWFSPIQIPRVEGWGKAHRVLREEPPAHGSLMPMKGTSSFHFTWDLDLNPHLLVLKCLRKGLYGCPTQRGPGPSTWQPSRVVTEGGRFQPPRAVSMVTAMEPSRAFEEHS